MLTDSVAPVTWPSVANEDCKDLGEKYTKLAKQIEFITLYLVVVRLLMKKQTLCEFVSLFLWRFLLRDEPRRRQRVSAVCLAAGSESGTCDCFVLGPRSSECFGESREDWRRGPGSAPCDGSVDDGRLLSGSSSLSLSLMINNKQLLVCVTHLCCDSFCSSAQQKTAPAASAVAVAKFSWKILRRKVLSGQ